MPLPKKYSLIQFLSLSILFFIFVISLSSVQKPKTVNPAQGFSATPTPIVFYPYKIPKLPNTRAYRIMLVGDSMIDALGDNAPLLRQHLIELYPDHEFVIYNYGFGSTTIESLPTRLTQTTTYNGRQYPAILTQGFDLIIIESFAYNPIEQSSFSDNLAKHRQILDQSIRQIIKTHPESIVAVMVTIAPNKEHFAQGVYDLTSKERAQWADERVSYIKDTIDFAKQNKIPLINMYEKTLTPDGDGNLKYINPDDYVHPSAEGVDFISKSTAKFIYDNKFFPE